MSESTNADVPESVETRKVLESTLKSSMLRIKHITFRKIIINVTTNKPTERR